MLTVKNVVDILEKLAKPAYAFDWDNCGLCVGNESNNVTRVLVTLDVTRETVLEAHRNNCEMIISHHPLIFKPISTANSSTNEGEMLSLLFKYDIALYSAHTSLDAAKGGVNDALCQKLGLINVEVLAPINIDGEEVSCGRIGNLPQKMSGDELLSFVETRLNCKNLLFGGVRGKEFSRIALASGAGDDFYFDAYKAGADVFLTGEVKYHTALEMKRISLPFLAAGHYSTEVSIVEALGAYLQNRFDVLQCGVTVIKSRVSTDPFDN